MRVVHCRCCFSICSNSIFQLHPPWPMHRPQAQRSEAEISQNVEHDLDSRHAELDTNTRAHSAPLSMRHSATPLYALWSTHHHQSPNPSTPRPNPRQPPAHTHPPHHTPSPQPREDPSKPHPGAGRLRTDQPVVLAATVFNSMVDT